MFDVDPRGRDGMTSIKVTQYHALDADPVSPTTGVHGPPNPHYIEFETFTLVRPRSDRGVGRARRELRRSPVSV